MEYVIVQLWMQKKIIVETEKKHVETELTTQKNFSYPHQFDRHSTLFQGGECFVVVSVVHLLIRFATGDRSSKVRIE